MPLTATTASNSRVEHPRLLLIIAKVLTVALAFHLWTDEVWVYRPIYQMLLVVSLLVLLPRFGWVLPTTIAGILITLSGPRHTNWDPADDFVRIGVSTGIAFLAGCVFDWNGKRRELHRREDT